MYYRNFPSPGTPRAQILAGAEGEAGMTVTELNRLIAGAIRADGRTRHVTVTAEVSGFKHHIASGHWYFSLKDEGSTIACVMFRQNNLRGAQIRPEDGDSVTVSGHIELFERDGKVQLYVDTLRAAGTGSLYEQFEALKRKLQAEGLFDPGRKKPLPMVPRRVALVTSDSGKALYDILNVSGMRNPSIPVVLVPSGVQGATAPAELIRALRRAQNLPEVDVIIISRGGGSVEDLWCFNDEGLARAIAACSVPVVSGVGHELDFTICDYVSDVRASTPSNAAEIVFPDRRELRQRSELMRNTLARAMENRLNRALLLVRERQNALSRLSPERRIRDLTESVVRLREMLRRSAERRMDDALRETAIRRLELTHGMERMMEDAGAHIRNLDTRLRAVNPLGVLERGYALVYNENDQVLTGAAEAKKHRDMTLRFADGRVAVTRKDGA